MAKTSNYILIFLFYLTTIGSCIAQDYLFFDWQTEFDADEHLLGYVDNFISVSMEEDVLVGVHLYNFQSEIMLYKFDANGVLIWDFHFNTIESDYLRLLETDSDGNHYMVVQTSTLSDTPDYAADATVILKISAEGEELWRQQLGIQDLSSMERSSYRCEDVLFDDDGLYLTGLRDDNLNDGLTAKGILTKFSLSNGSIVWEISDTESIGVDVGVIDNNIAWTRFYGGQEFNLSLCSPIDGVSNYNYYFTTPHFQSFPTLFVNEDTTILSLSGVYEYRLDRLTESGSSDWMYFPDNQDDTLISRTYGMVFTKHGDPIISGDIDSGNGPKQIVALLDRNTGSPHWEIEFDTSAFHNLNSMINTPNEIILIGSGWYSNTNNALHPQVQAFDTLGNYWYPIPLGLLPNEGRILSMTWKNNSLYVLGLNTENPGLAFLLKTSESTNHSSSEIENTRLFNYYPNPAQNNVLLHGISQSPCYGILFDQYGRTARKFEFIPNNKSEVLINLEGLSSGIYHLTITESISKHNVITIIKH